MVIAESPLAADEGESNPTFHFLAAADHGDRADLPGAKRMGAAAWRRVEALHLDDTQQFRLDPRLAAQRPLSEIPLGDAMHRDRPILENDPIGERDRRRDLRFVGGSGEVEGRELGAEMHRGRLELRRRKECGR